MADFDWAEAARGWEAVAGLVAMAVGVIAWAYRNLTLRASARDKQISEQVLDSREANAARFQHLEGRVGELEDRLTDVERKLDGVATREDIASLRVAQAAIDARLDGMLENDRRLLELVNAQGQNLQGMMKMLINLKDST